MSEVRRLPVLLSESQAADKLGVSIATMQRMRKRGDIAWRQIGGRVRYTIDDVRDYIEGARRCANDGDRARSETSGFPSGPTPTLGASLGSIQLPDRQSANQLARQIFGRRS